MSDLENATRMVNRYSGEVIITPALGTRIWHENRWVTAEVGDLKQLAIDLIRDEPNEFPKQSMSRSRIDAMVNLFSVAVRASVEEFEEEIDTANLFNCANVTLDLSGKKPHAYKHRPHDYLTFVSPVEYNARAKCPTIDAWLAEMLPPSDVQVFFEMVGLLLVEELRYKSAFFLHGEHNTAKSTMLNLIRALLGPDLVWSATLQALTADKFALADLYGKRANICGDLPSTRIVDSSTFKMLTGGDLIRTQRKGGHPFQFVNQARLLFATNELPTSRDRSDAYTARHLILHFTRVWTVEERRKRSRFEQEIHAELPGFLNKAIVGLQRLRSQDGFTRSSSVENARSDYKRSLFPIAEFVESHLVVERKASVGKRDLYLKYLEVHGDRAGTPSANEFNRELQQLLGARVRDRRLDNGKIVRRNGQPMWIGVRFV